MKSILQSYLKQALTAMKNNGLVGEEVEPIIKLEQPKVASFGDWSTNLALLLAKECRKPPKEFAEQIIIYLQKQESVVKVEFAPPGFVNIWLKTDIKQQIVKDILQQKDGYASNQVSKPLNILLEYVSANPTGPLHVGHGRAAVFGSSLANILKKVGHNVCQEYYVNDAGKQIDILTVTLYLRYLEQCNIQPFFPPNLYQGEYLKAIAKSIKDKDSNKFLIEWQFPAFKPVNEHEKKEEAENYLEELISFCKAKLAEKYDYFKGKALDSILATIKGDLKALNVDIEKWFFESSLQEENMPKIIEQLTANNWVKESKGALWFKSKQYGDEKDRVLKRSNGKHTYFATDLAYHADKLQRGFDLLVNIWGADHHGYIKRMKAGISALGENAEKLKILLVQFAHLVKNNQKLPMSTRSGKFIELNELFSEVGVDATRFFFCAHSCEQHMNFDMDLAKSKTNENPVFYIQYAHARIHAVLQQAELQKIEICTQQWLEDKTINYLSYLVEPEEIKLMELLAKYQQVIYACAENYAPNLLTIYLQNLAKNLHSYYNRHKFIQKERAQLTHARILLLGAVKIILHDGLKLLGINAPDNM